MAKKQPEDVGETEDLEAQLNEVAIKAEVRKGGAGGGRIIPTELASALKTKFDNDGAFAVPKDWLEGKMGLDTDKPMKGRPNAIKKKLNKQHGDLAGELHIWHVGNSGDTFYAIGILEATSEEEEKWKKPKPKAEED